MERNCYFLLNYNENSSLFLISWILYAQLNDSKLLSGDVKQLQIQCHAPLLIFPMHVRVSSLELIPYYRLEMKNLSHRAQGFILPLLITVSISIGNCCKRLRVGVFYVFFSCFLNILLCILFAFPHCGKYCHVPVLTFKGDLVL